MRARTWATLTCAAAFVACDDDDGRTRTLAAEMSSPTVSLTEVVDVLGEIEVEENDRVINVAPISFDDTDGGFLIADLKEGQVRLYGRDGHLRGVTGGPGDGPGEFRSPIVVHRLPDERLVTGNFVDARLTLFSAAADSVLDTQNPPLFPLYNALPLSSERLLLAGRQPGFRTSPLLHVWNLVSEEIEASFFSVPVSAELASAALSVGFVGLDTRADTLYATFSLSDTLYAFDLGASPPRPVGKIPIPLKAFRAFAPEGDARGSMEARRRWLSRLTPIQAVHAMPRSFLVLWGETRGAENLWHWVHFARDGTPSFELRNGGQVMTTRSDTIFFIDPRELVPNRWKFGVLKPRVQKSR